MYMSHHLPSLVIVVLPPFCIFLIFCTYVSTVFDTDFLIKNKKSESKNSSNMNMRPHKTQ